MSTQTITPVEEPIRSIPEDLNTWLDKFDRREKLLVLLSLSTKLSDDNLEGTIFSAVLDRLCDDDELFCVYLVDAMYRKLSIKKCFTILRQLNHKLASEIIEQMKGGGHE